MDADLSHPPEAIAALVSAMDDPNVDFVIGSRYVAGGKIDEDWGVFRYLTPKSPHGWHARSRRPKIRWPDFSHSAERRLSRPAQLNPVGYKIGLELIVKCGCRRIAEVPIHFNDRVHGESKLSLREQINYVRHLKRLYEFRFRNWAYLAQFLTVWRNWDGRRPGRVRRLAGVVTDRLGTRVGHLGSHDVEFLPESKTNFCLRRKWCFAAALLRFLCELLPGSHGELVRESRAHDTCGSHDAP